MSVIDYCTIFSGPNAGILARVSYNSLFKVSDVGNVRFHVIIKDASDDDVQQIKNLLSGKSVEYYQSPKGDVLRGPNETTTNNWDDVGRTCDFIMRNCGDCQWCAMAHFDMIYEKDLLSLCQQKISRTVGMIGQHERFLMINREAYKDSQIKFASITGFVAVPAWPEPTNNQLQIRHRSHPFVNSDTAIAIRGFDTAELLELELSSYGWRIEPMLLELRECITHFGGGGSFYGEHPNVSIHRDRALKLIKERGL